MPIIFTFLQKKVDIFLKIRILIRMGIYRKQTKPNENHSHLEKRATFFKFALEKFGFAHIYNNMITTFQNKEKNYGKENRKNQSPNLQRDWQQNETISKRNDFARENKQRHAYENHGLDFIALLGWVGAITIVVAPFFNLIIWCILAIFGLALLTIQAIKNRVNNLIFLNISSIIVFLIRLIGEF